MDDDPRCCGSGTCIIDLTGRCWCGHQWDGEKMAAPPFDMTSGCSPPAVDPDIAAHP